MSTPEISEQTVASETCDLSVSHEDVPLCSVDVMRGESSSGTFRAAKDNSADVTIDRQGFNSLYHSVTNDAGLAQRHKLTDSSGPSGAATQDTPTQNVQQPVRLHADSRHTDSYDASEYKEDGSIIERDGHSRVTRVEDATRTVHSFGYDERGEVNKVVRPDGTYRRGQGDNWSCDHDPQYRWQGKVTVDTDGTYSFRETKSGTTTNRNTDGTSRINRGSGGSIDFDTCHRPVEFRESNGSVLHHNKDGSLTVTRLQDGRQVTKTLDQVSMSCTDDGKVTLEKPDQSRMVYNADGSEIVTHNINGEDKVTNLRDANNNKYKFGYGRDGQVNEVTRQDGIYSRGNNDTWTRRGLDGTASKNYKWQGTVEVSKDGSYSYTDTTSGVTTCTRLDGTSQISRPDGDIEFNRAGRPLSYKKTDGDVWEQRQDGLHITDKNGASRTLNTTMEVTQDGTISYSLGQSKYSSLPSGALTESEMIKGRQKITKITDNNGDAFTFKYDAQGNVIEFANKNGSLMRSDDGIWHRKDSQGRPDASYKWKGEIVAYANGDHEFIDLKHTSGMYHSADGTVSQRHKTAERLPEQSPKRRRA